MKLFPTYRVLAYVVGVLLVFGTVVSLCKYLLPEGSALQTFGEDFSIVWMLHGFVYMAYVVVAFLLSHRAGWSLQYFLLMMVAGLIPGLMFWVERNVAHKVRTETPELLTS